MAPDDGYFPRGTSMLRRVHERHQVGLFYGQRALTVGALKPVNYIGTSRHTAHKETPFKRLIHTAIWFEDVMLGTRAEADKVLAAVEKMHGRVNGVIPEDAGPCPAGTPYDAFDPAMMLWTVAVMMDSAECFHDLLVRRLRPREREDLWQDYVRFAELFGMPRDAAPPSHREFRAWFGETLAGDTLHLTDEARYIGRATTFEIPMPPVMQPFKRAHDLIQLGALPARVRRMYGLPWSPAHAVAFRGAVLGLKATGTALLPRGAGGRNTRAFELVAATEAHRIRRGIPTPQVLDVPATG